MGILFKNSEALETAERLTTILFDKTGTITQGKPALTDWLPLAGGAEPPGDGEEALALAASAEAASEHPLAQAVAAGARALGAALEEPEEFVAQSGLGVEARVRGRRVRVGRLEWVAENAAPDSEARRLAEKLTAEGKTVMAVAIDGRLRGLLAAADQEKANAREAVERLHALGLKPVMLTGDNPSVGRAVASRVGIERVVAGVLPDQKESLVREEQGRGGLVAMVGDGINDAPALARADVGIAIGTGADVAKEASDITLVGGDLMGVARAVELSRATMRVIRQNLFWAFFYNVALIPIAAGALHQVERLPALIRDLHPALAAAAMALSSVTVVTNSLRLGRQRL
ncbi:MAG: HAD-IC family P-type ATPase, partial [Candidatus Sumerlaeota bacterium]|nr:HAD-IC family P-type ATPase [Candidatus Sumerlaeota bacterium]